MKKILLNAALIIVAALIVAWAAMAWLSVWTRHGDTITVPAVKTLSYSGAIRLLDDEGLKGIVVDSVFDTRTRPGAVIEQNPKAGTIVKEGREVFLTINAFTPKMVTLPSLTDISLRQARSILEGLDIKQIKERRVPSEFKDLVISARYKGSRLMPGARVPVNAVIELEVGEGISELEPVDSIDADSTIHSEQLDLF